MSRPRRVCSESVPEAEGRRCFCNRSSVSSAEHTLSGGRPLRTRKSSPFDETIAPSGVGVVCQSLPRHTLHDGNCAPRQPNARRVKLHLCAELTFQFTAGDKIAAPPSRAHRQFRQVDQEPTEVVPLSSRMSSAKFARAATTTTTSNISMVYFATALLFTFCLQTKIS
jgi:hypothetical protein